MDGGAQETAISQVLLKGWLLRLAEGRCAICDYHFPLMQSGRQTGWQPWKRVRRVPPVLTLLHVTSTRGSS